MRLTRVAVISSLGMNLRKFHSMRITFTDNSDIERLTSQFYLRHFNAHATSDAEFFGQKSYFG